MTARHFGQRIFLPAEFSGAFNFDPHPSHCTMFGIEGFAMARSIADVEIQEGTKDVRQE